MWGDTIKRTTLLPLAVLAISLFAIYGKELRDSRTSSIPRSGSDVNAANASHATEPNLGSEHAIQLPAIYQQPSRRFSGDAWSRPLDNSTAPQTPAATERPLDLQSEGEATSDSNAHTRSVPLTAPNSPWSVDESSSRSETENLVSKVTERLEILGVTQPAVESRERNLDDATELEAEQIASLFQSIVSRNREAPVGLSQDFVADFLQQVAKSQGLVRKGALFSAESEASAALLSLARTLDGMGPSRDHERACRIGLQALQEATELHDATADSNDVDRMRLIARRHVTFRAVVPDHENFDRATALESYYRLAIPLLAFGAGYQPVAAEAFVTLGKIHAIAPVAGVDGLGPFQNTMTVPKSVVFHQVALLVHPGHSVAANELAVQLGRLGQWQIAKDLLISSVRSRPSPEAWRNLAEAHQRLGQPQYAQLAMHEAQMMQSGQLTPHGLMTQTPAVLNAAPTAQPMNQSSRTAQGSGNGVPFFAGVR